MNMKKLVLAAVSACAVVLFIVGKTSRSSIRAQQEVLTTTIEAIVKGTMMAETEVVETIETICETVTEETYDERKRYHALTVEDIINQLEAESKIEELTFIVFNALEEEYFLLEKDDFYEINIAETFLVYCSTATDFEQDVPSYKKITSAYRWHADQTVAEVFLRNFDGSVEATFVKRGNPAISKKITLSLDKSLQNGEWSYDDYLFSHMISSSD